MENNHKKPRGAYKDTSTLRRNRIQIHVTDNELALINQANTEGIALCTFVTKLLLNAIKK